MYVLGGASADTTPVPLSSTEYLDISNGGLVGDTWKSGPTMGTPHYQAAAALSNGSAL